MTEPTDTELTECYKAANGEDVGKAQPLTTQRIFRAMRAAITKWGTPPAVEGEPFGYFHQLLDHEGKGNDVWLGTKDREVVVQSHTPGETGDEIVALYTTPQPTQAQAGAVPLTESEMGEGWRRFQETLEDRMAADPAGVRNMGREHWLSWAHWKAACSFALGIKGGQHGADT